MCFQISRNGLLMLILLDVFSVLHRETQRERESDPTKAICGFNYPRMANVRHSCTAEKVHSGQPPPPPPTPGLIDVSDGEAGIPALLYF